MFYAQTDANCNHLACCGQQIHRRQTPKGDCGKCGFYAVEVAPVGHGYDLFAAGSGKVGNRSQRFFGMLHVLEHLGAKDLFECCGLQPFIYRHALPAENPSPTPQSLLGLFGKGWRDVDTPELAAQNKFEDVPDPISYVEYFGTLLRI